MLPSAATRGYARLRTATRGYHHEGSARGDLDGVALPPAGPFSSCELPRTSLFTLQRIAMRMDDSALSDHESAFVRPQREDSRWRTPARDAKGSSRPHLRGRSHLGKTLRQAPRRREAS